MEEAASEPSESEHFFSAAERQTKQKKNDLQLSRKRVVQQLESSTNERYSELLRRTLADLDAQIAALS